MAAGAGLQAAQALAAARAGQAAAAAATSAAAAAAGSGLHAVQVLRSDSGKWAGAGVCQGEGKGGGYYCTPKLMMRDRALDGDERGEGNGGLRMRD